MKTRTCLTGAFCLLMGQLLSACSGAGGDPGQEGANDTLNSPQQVVIEHEAGNQIIDDTYAGMVDLGSSEGWQIYFDKATNHVVLTDGISEHAFDPNTLDDAAIESLRQAGVPETLLWSWKGVLCRAACWGAAGAGCAAVAGVCAWGTVFTVGGFAIPCAYAIVAACGAAGAGASVCSDWCTDRYG